MSRKIVHYSIDEIDSKGANVNLIWGERSNGKSYQVKHKKGVIPFLEDVERYYDNYIDKGKIIKEVQKSGKRFILMRRFKEEINAAWIESYFSDVDVESLTDGEYNMITMFRRELYLTYYDIETHKSRRGAKIGYAVSLSTEQNYAGGSYLDVSDIIFEEFMSRTTYLHDEPNKLLNFYSTVDRKRGTTKMWLVGNTITRVCPYIQEWGLNEVIFRQKQGEIKTLWLSTGEVDDDGIPIEVKLAVEHCKSTGNSSFVFGTHANMLNKGEWQSDPQPKLPKSYKEYKCLFRFAFHYKTFTWLCEYLLDKETKDVVWFIYPYSGKLKRDIIVFSDIIKTSRYWQKDIYNPLIKNKTLVDLFKTFRENRIFYSTDLCGTEFKQSIDFEIRR